MWGTDFPFLREKFRIYEFPPRCGSPCQSVGFKVGQASASTHLDGAFFSLDMMKKLIQSGSIFQRECSLVLEGLWEKVSSASSHNAILDHLLTHTLKRQIYPSTMDRQSEDDATLLDPISFMRNISECRKLHLNEPSQKHSIHTSARHMCHESAHPRLMVTLAL